MKVSNIFLSPNEVVYIEHCKIQMEGLFYVETVTFHNILPPPPFSASKGHRSEEQFLISEDVTRVFLPTQGSSWLFSEPIRTKEG